MLHAGRWSERGRGPREAVRTPGPWADVGKHLGVCSPLAPEPRHHLPSASACDVNTWLPARGSPAGPPARLPSVPRRGWWGSAGLPRVSRACGWLVVLNMRLKRLSVWYQRPLSKRVQPGPWDRRQVKTRQPGGCRCRLRRTETMQAHQARAWHRPRRGGGRSRDPGSAQLCPACGGIGLWVCLSALYHRLCERRPHAGSS